MATAKDINDIVRAAARRKKEDDLKKSATEKNSSTDAAMSQKRQFDEEVTRKRTDYVRILKISIPICVIAAMCLIAAKSLSYMNAQEKDLWKKPPVLPSDYKKVSEFIMETIKKTAKNGNIEEFFMAGAPPPWIVSAKKIFRDPGVKDYTVKEVELDMRKLGNEAVFHVQCENPSGGEMSITLLMRDGIFRIMKINGIMKMNETLANEIKRDEDRKNEK